MDADGSRLVQEKGIRICMLFFFTAAFACFSRGEIKILLDVYKAGYRKDPSSHIIKYKKNLMHAYLILLFSFHSVLS